MFDSQTSSESSYYLSREDCTVSKGKCEEIYSLFVARGETCLNGPNGAELRGEIGSKT